MIKVYDGDTCTVDIDLGLGTWVKGEKIRLSRINAPEIRGDERKKGLASRDALRELIYGKDILLQTIKDKKGKYGRYIGEIWIQHNDSKINISDWLVSNNYAVYRDY
ncbi:MAG: nuclease [Candidatus Marinimicrobia bacterium]|jgi:micrococcal nuclease|nr:nuclease [Candidatus Neomarinimicrobiota bacterium]MBT3633108.1 nuclease [Candidatus Neomarinimicrobiota bacterium]MBT3682291.1 nuclease [Candidatus Neomarinimicrobiota bacterium]MBT3758708.1 nuclease [Candidatus Neomarinimicrobiota bacterium]MBT3895418.1 nuclease [Candidatus Neomarinimicrobiota bacterium]